MNGASAAISPSAPPSTACFSPGGSRSLEQEAAREFLPFCIERGIGVIVGGPFNSGILATGAVAGARYNYAPAPPEIVDRVQRIAAVVGRYGVPLAAAALAFPLRHPAVASVIPGVMSKAEAAAAAARAEARNPRRALGGPRR